MHRKFFLNLIAVIVTSTALIFIFVNLRTSSASAQTTETQGSLRVLDQSGKKNALCPLKHTDVRVEISGFLSRVNVTQEFENPFNEKIEAVYVFPLPANAAVDDMTMIVGQRIVRGKILRRVDGIKGKSHEVELERLSAHSAHVRLKSNATIPNKDFVLSYDVAGKSIQDALLAHRSAKGGYFTLILQPPERITVADVTPKELVFVLDTSGSMNGFPIEKAKETMKLALDGLYPADTFNVITFAGDTRILFPQPVPATPANLRKAQESLAATVGYGGTEMMKAIRASLDPSDSQDHVRIVCFMTDGYVGNDMEIISEVKKHSNARVFAFGIGGSVNRFLLDKISEYGRGEVEYVALNDDGSAAARRFHERVRNPLLTDISIDWNGLPVPDVYPQRIPDLFGAKPVILTGRYTAAGHGIIRLKGKMAGREFVREIAVDFPDTEPQHNVLSSLWARQRIDALIGQDYSGMQQGSMKPELKETITNLGLEHSLMTQFTSFVAVEEMIVTDGGQLRRIDVPVEVPEGVNRDAVQNSQGGPTGLFTTYQGNASKPRLISFGKANVVTKSGTNSSMARSRRAAGAGGGLGTGQLPANAPAPRAARVAVMDADPAESLKVLSPAEKKRAELQSKLHPSIVAVVDRLKSKSPIAGADEAKFIRDGKAEIQIWLTDQSEETLAKLKELGFEVVLAPKSVKLIIGRLSIEKLEGLAELKYVRYVAPQVSS